ncbi:zinc finger protein 2 homolog isoform X2 [Folsomia candida]|uniref:zinc finger protein 2 homolog isoform X2 n=1 Tax=Folsomia candida TaxID=158441 RepID=UPI001605479E|nr:zinc finger protein 2 homolog isoform X2 [Folsomia candida]
MDNSLNLSCYICGVSDKLIVPLKVEYSQTICQLLRKNNVFLKNSPQQTDQIQTWNNCYHCCELISELNRLINKQGKIVDQIKNKIEKAKSIRNLAQITQIKEEEECESEAEEFFCKIEVEPDPKDDEEGDSFVLHTFDPPPMKRMRSSINTMQPPKTPRAPLPCPICNKLFRGGHGRRRRQDHIDRVHGNIEKFTCRYCTGTFSTNGHWLNHLLKKHERLQNEKSLCCTFCEKKFAISELYERHVENHTKLDGTLPFFCQICDTRFQRQDQLDQHTEKAHAVNGINRKPIKYSCSLCEATFSSQGKLSTHQRAEHPTLLTWICGRCNSAHLDETHLATHSLLHKEGLGSYSCLVCKKAVFKTKVELNLHLSGKHSGEEIVPCGVDGCPKRFSSLNDKLHHLGSEHKEPVFKCNYCEERFTKYQARIMHEKQAHKDQGIESFPCQWESCDKEFPTRLALGSHVRMRHKRRGAKTCEVCGKELSTMASYKNHMKIHNGVKDLICDVCGRGFSCLKGLKDHQITHTGERPFKCKLCDKAYTQGHVLKTHVSKVHGSEEIKN